MVAIKDNTMGRFAVEVELANNDDVVRARDGTIAPEQVRRTRIAGTVDTGATRLVLPQSVVAALGIERGESANVRYADGRMAMRDLAPGVQLTYIGRQGVFTAVVEPNREQALIGAIVLEDLDLIVDCSAQKLLPRDPNSIISEIE